MKNIIALIIVIFTLNANAQSSRRSPILIGGFIGINTGDADARRLMAEKKLATTKAQAAINDAYARECEARVRASVNNPTNKTVYLAWLKSQLTNSPSAFVTNELKRLKAQ